MEKEIELLKKELAELKAYVRKNDFSNLYVFDTPVQFKRANVYPLDATAIATSTTDSTGRIAVKINGVTRYVPYF